MDFFLVLKILFVIGVMIALYAIIRNLDILKIILISYMKLKKVKFQQMKILENFYVKHCVEKN